MVEGISKKEFNKYCKEMWERLKKGEKKYGCSFKSGDIKKAILEEAVDLSNYSLMLYLKSIKFNKNIKC